MLLLAFKKLIRNGWLSICLCVGLVAAVALVTSIPMYSEGALQRVLRQDIIDYRDDRNKYPGGLLIRRTFDSAQDSLESLLQLPAYEAEFRSRLLDNIPLPLTASTSRFDLKSMFISEAQTPEEERSLRTARISSLPGIESHISLISGRLPTASGEALVYEVLVHEEAMKDMDFLIGKTFDVFDLQLRRVCSVHVTGAFRVDESSRAYWHTNLKNFDRTFFVPAGRFLSIFTPEMSNWAIEVTWYFGFDTSQIATSKAPSLKKVLEEQSEWLAEFDASTDIPLIGIIDEYLDKQESLTTLLIFLIAPVFIIAAYFLFMLVELIMESEANDIALLKSRGAPSGQVAVLYFIMFSIPNFLALLTGPVAGWGIARLLGAADGFLQFGNTEGFAATLNPRIWFFASIAVLICFATILIPIIRSSKVTIVLHKARGVRSGKSWMKRGFILGASFVLIALYALYSYRMRQQILVITSAEGIDLPLDPLFFVAASLYIFGAGMLVLRLLPPIISVLFRLFRRVLPVVLYTALLRVGRSFTRERYAFTFLLLTVASGIFYSSAARTMNLATEHRLLYANGADVRLVPLSGVNRNPAGSTASSISSSTMGELGETQTGGSSNAVNYMKYIYEKRKLVDQYPALGDVKRVGSASSSEIDDYVRIEGVESATLVARIPEAILVAPNGRREAISIIAVDPESFGETSWYRNDLNPYTLQSYLEALAYYPDHVFASTTLLDQYQYDLGKPFSVQIRGAGSFDVYVADTVEFWPSLNPYELMADDLGFIVCNLNYLDAMVPIEQMEVWLDRNDRVDEVTFYTSLLENGFDFVALNDSAAVVRAETRAPEFAAFNGALSLSFIVTVAVSLLGFVICWVVSLHERQLQFGVFRSLGMTSRSVVAILMWEQVIISGSAILAGSAIGSQVSQLFLPILGLTASAGEQVPPLQIGAYKSDYFTIVGIVFVMLLFAFIFLGIFVSRMKVHQALKLGED